MFTDASSPLTPEGLDTGVLLTAGEVAALFRVNRKTVSRWATLGRLGSIRTPGGHRRFHATEVHDLLDTLTTEANNPGPDH